MIIRHLHIITLVICVTILATCSCVPVSQKRQIFLREQVLDTEKHSETNDVPLSTPNTLYSWLPSFVAKRFSKLRRATYNDDGSVRSYIFHFEPSTLTDPKGALESLGVEVGHYLPHNSYIGTATKSQVAEAKELDGMLWVGDFRPEHKMPNEARVRGHLAHHTRLFHEHARSTDPDPNRRQQDSALSDNPGAPFGAGQRSLLESTATTDSGHSTADSKATEPQFTVFAHIARRNELSDVKKLASDWEQKIKTAIGPKAVAVVAAARDKIAAGAIGADAAHRVAQWLTEIGHVHWVEIKPETLTHNKYAARLLQSFDQSTPVWDLGIRGEGEVIGVGDTGLDTYTCFFYDENAPVPYQRNAAESVTSKHRKIEGYWEFMDKSDSELGHGTHVASSACGKAHTTLSANGLSDYDSAAKNARLAFMDCGCDTDGGCACPPDTACECDLKEGKKCERRFGLVYLPLSLSEGYFPWHYSKGARVVSNSWGTGYYRDFTFGYSTSSAEIDEFVWRHRDFLPVFAAGNSGGQFGYASLTSEAESKNALVIGAAQSSLDSFKNVHVNFTDFTVLAKRIQFELQQAYCPEESEHYDKELCTRAQSFTAADCCDRSAACKTISESCCGTQVFPQFKKIGFRCCPECISWEMDQIPAHFNQNNLAMFTARGPTLDGRIKPDVVTVGDKILSARSFGTSADKKCSAATPLSDSLIKHEGTSMAAPIAASAAVLVRQYFRQGYHPTGAPVRANQFDPSAALVKAMVIHSAQTLTGLVHLASKNLWYPIQFKEGERFKLRSPYFQGFGRIELQRAIGRKSGLYIPNTRDRTINTGDIHAYCLQLSEETTAAQPFKVTLVWTDPPSTPAAQINLVNDIDLIVIDDTGAVSYGNGKHSTIGSAREEPDYLNNVEQIEITAAKPTAKFHVIVRGTHIAQGPQPYALVVSGAGIAVSKNCAVVNLATNPQLATYKSLSMLFGLTTVVLVPMLFALAVYFYLQHRAVTTTRRGYKDSRLSDSDAAEYMQIDSFDPAPHS